MWTTADLHVEIEEAEHPTAVVTVLTPAGTVKLMAELTLVGGVLRATDAHVQGLHPGALGRAGLNAIARKLLEETGADTLVVEGFSRTTGVRPGRRPRPFRFPR